MIDIIRIRPFETFLARAMLPAPNAASTAVIRIRISWRRGEQPAVLCRTIILTAFQNSALKALAEAP
ncbi:MAG: hypothetical protein ACJ76N_06220 [Thermoanaerobaculia bacterium]